MGSGVQVVVGLCFSLFYQSQAVSVPLILMGLPHAEIVVEATERMEPISTSENSGGS